MGLHNLFIILFVSTFIVASVLGQRDSFTDFEQTSNFRSICSRYNRSEPILIDLSETQEGYLLSHDFDYSLSKNDEGESSAQLITNLVPFKCAWQLVLVDGNNINNGGNDVVSLEFVDFDIPETEIPEEDGEGDDDGSKICSQNYVKISTIDSTYVKKEPRFLAGYCGSGVVPRLQGQIGKSLLVEARITQPFRGFRIKFEKTQDSGQGRSVAGGFCGQDSYFSCPDPRTGVKCLPTTFKCDGRRDCYEGEDEANCEASSRAQLPDHSDSGCGSPRRNYGEEGVIRSMSYPHQPYENNARCQWLIVAPPRQHIRVEFEPKFGIEMQEGLNADECLYDSLSFFIYKPGEQSAPLTLFAKVCGALPPPPTVIPHSQILVTFESNDFNNFDGFEFRWKAVDPETPLSGSDESRIDLGGQEDQNNNDNSNTLLPPEEKAKWPGSAIRPSPTTTAQPSVVNAGNRVSSNPCSPNGATLTSVSGMISTPSNFDSSVKTCSWTISPRLPTGSTQSRVDLRFYDFTVDPTQDCTKPVLEVVFESNKGKRARGVYTCGGKMPPFEEAEFASTSKPVQIIFHTNNGKRNTFEVGYIVIATRSSTARPTGSSGGAPGAVTAKPVPPTFALVKNCGKSLAPVPAPSMGGSTSSSATRIVGGMPAKPGSWPWAAELTYQGRHLCGATILDDTAHCFKQRELHKKQGWEVVIGRHTIAAQRAWDRISPILKPKIKRIMVHKRYQQAPGDKSYDIALIQLEERIKNAKIAKPACLPTRAIRTTDRCVVVGWGDTKGSGGEGVLKQAAMPIFDNNKCRAMNQLYAAQVKDTMVCAGYEAGGIDSCQGDSGGPLACFVNGRWEVHGVVSFGKGCAGANAPGVYTRVWCYMDWLKKVTTMGLKQRRSIHNDDYASAPMFVEYTDLEY